MQKLSSHRSNPQSDNFVEVGYSKGIDAIEINFKVSAKKLHINPSFSQDTLNNFGLWDFDVVEVFLQGASEDGAYLELQCSPLGQKFALKIIEPRKKTAEVAQLNGSIKHQQLANGFEVQFIVKSADIPGDFSHLKGNLTACLGAKDAREYYALNINNEEQADFHRPDLFLELR